MSVSSFTTVPFAVDSQAIADTAIETLRTNIPGWEPNDGALEVWLISALAEIAATATVVAAQVPASVFAQFGTQLIGLPPISATYATMPTIWTAADTLGHTIPAGTQVGYQVSGDTLIVFETTTAVTIAPGASTISPVVLQAVVAGTAANGVPAGPLTLVDALSWVTAVSATSPSSGGVDAETSSAYLARLTAELRLLAPRPILPGDYATMAQNVTGVYRAGAVNGYNPGNAEVQQIAVTGTPTGGTFTLTFGAQTTSAIAYNATAATVQTALQALSSIGSGNILVTGGPLPGTALTATFAGTMALAPESLITATGSLTGGTSPAVAVTRVTAGLAPSSGNARTISVCPLTSTGAAVSPTIAAAVQAYLAALREVNFLVFTIAPTFTTVNVAYSVHVLAGYTGSAVTTAVNAALTALLSPANWGGGLASPPTWDTSQATVRINQVIAAIMAVPGVGYATSVTLNGSAADVTLTGTAPLPTVGTLTPTLI